MTGSTTADNTENVRKHPGNTKGVQLGGYKYNPSIVMSICNNLREGKGRVNSVVGCGVSFRQFCTWMKKYPDFKKAVEEAEEELRVARKDVAIDAVFNAMKNNTWQAGAWWLERSYPEEYGLRQSSQISLNIPVKVNYLMPDNPSVTIESIDPQKFLDIENIKEEE